MAKQCALRNTSTTTQKQFTTKQGNVKITQFKRGLWQVFERGGTPFMVRSERTAKSEACGIERRRAR